MGKTINQIDTTLLKTHNVDLAKIDMNKKDFVESDELSSLLSSTETYEAPQVMSEETLAQKVKDLEAKLEKKKKFRNTLTAALTSLGSIMGFSTVGLSGIASATSINKKTLFGITAATILLVGGAGFGLGLHYGKNDEIKTLENELEMYKKAQRLQHIG